LKFETKEHRKATAWCFSAVAGIKRGSRVGFLTAGITET
jgi:hypothetical protein